MFESTRCHKKGKVFKNALWQNVYQESAQVLFVRMNQYRDHLGNVRVNYVQDPQSGALGILDESHYYPFGLQHKNYNSDLTKIDRKEENNNEKDFDDTVTPFTPFDNPGYKYKFNGMELQSGFGVAPMAVQNFQKTGSTQSIGFGFGSTKLSFNSFTITTTDENDNVMDSKNVTNLNNVTINNDTGAISTGGDSLQ